MLRWLLISATCSLAIGLSAQNAWTVERLTVGNGLPQNTVRSMAFDTLGYLWLTTEGGLVRYDGMRTRTFSSRSGADLDIDRMGNLLSMPNGGLLLTDAIGDLYAVHVDGPKRVVDRDTLIDAGKNLSGHVPNIARYATLLRLESTMQRGDLFNTVYMPVLAFDAHSWAVVGPKAVHLFEQDRLLRSITVAAQPHMDHLLNGTLYLWNTDGSCQRLDREAGRLRPVRVKGGPRSAPIQRIHFQPGAEHVFALSADTLWRVLQDGPDALRFEFLLAGLPQGTTVLSVCMSPDGSNVFLGTPDQGVLRYRRASVGRVQLPDGADADRSFYGLVPLGSSSVLTRNGWVGTRHGFYRGPLQGVNYAGEAMHIDPQGRFWSGANDTLAIRDPRTGAIMKSLPARAGYPTSFLQHGDTVWVAGLKGLAWYVDDRLIGSIPLAIGDLRDRVYVLAVAPDGSIWAGTGKGLMVVDRAAGRLVVMPWSDGKFVRALYRWQDRMLVGTYGDGIFVLKGEEVQHLPLDRAGDATHVHAFIPDTKGWIWLPTNRGLFRFHTHDLEQHLRGDAALLPYAYQHVEEAAGPVEFNGGCTPAFATLKDGHLVLPTMNGLVWLKPDSIPHPWPNGAPRVDALWLDGEALDAARLSGPLPAGSLVQLEVSLPFWGDARNHQLLYRLRGLTQEFLPLPADGRLAFERLPAGTYALEVMLPGTEAVHQTLLRFRVLAPWYLRWWAVLAAAGCLVAVGQFIARQRVRIAQQRQSELEGKVAEKTAALRKEGEVRENLVRIMMHDIMAPITAMARVGRMSDERSVQLSEEEVRAAFVDMANASYQLHDTASQLLEWMKHQGGQIKVLREHVAVHGFVQGILDRLRTAAVQQGVTLRNRVDEELIVRTDQAILGIVVHNLVSNAIKHAPGAEVVVTAESVGPLFRLTVADTGPGLQPAALQRVRDLLEGHGGADRLRSGSGYVIIADMAALLDARVQVESVPRQGTNVLVEIPAIDHT